MIRKVISYKLWVMSLITLLTYNSSLITNHSCFAQDTNKLVSLSKQIIEAKTREDLYAPFKELKELYVEDNKYSEFVEFLKSLEQKKKSLEPFTNYYIAEARYYQLKYLQDSQSWDEYFAQGNTYRDQITEGSGKTIASTTAKEPLNVYSRLLLWKFHKDQEDAFKEDALSDLSNATREYSQGTTTNIAPIKDVADQLLSYGERGKAKELYRVYVDKLVTSDIKDDELKDIASGFYEKGSLELSQSIYDVYIERISKSKSLEKLIPILTDIAKLFSYKDDGPSDAFYAQKIFQKIEDVGGKEAFTEELIYLRAFNLEKVKEYIKAKNIYIDLVKRYPLTTHADEADFKVGIVYTYVVRDINSGKTYFEKLAQKETLSPQVISSFYQLGLLNQWEEDLVKAKEYYDKLIERAKDGFQETVTLTKERLKEIEESKPIEYNLKIFLDVSLNEEYMMLDMSKLDLKAQPYRAKKEDNVNVTSQPYLAESGCFQVELQYLWSGHIGTTKPSSSEASFNTKYLHTGTKEVNLVVVSPTGIVDHDIVMADVY